ncbi:MAG TPA: hypothetical protein VK817_10040 [Trebonia sp.]|jgi:hypothetical protein|nr:hypothetical protein [Trebonia sp.]
MLTKAAGRPGPAAMFAVALATPRFFRASFTRSFGAIAVRGAIITVLSSGLGFAARG